MGLPMRIESSMTWQLSRPAVVGGTAVAELDAVPSPERRFRRQMAEPDREEAQEPPRGVTPAQQTVSPCLALRWGSALTRMKTAAL